VQKRSTIMIVDDEEPNLRQLEMMLARDYAVVTAKNGREALDALRGSNVSVVITDQRMPAMSGIEFLIEAEKLHHPATRIILTGFADLKSVVDAMNKGKVFRYLTKPIDEAELMSAVNQGYEHFMTEQTNLSLMSQIKELMEDNAQMSKQLNRTPSEMKSRNTLFIQEPKRVNLAVMMIDIRGFSEFSKKHSPAETISILQSIYQPIHKLIYETGGSVDKHMGDGLMAIFGLDGRSGIQQSIIAAEQIANTYPMIANSLIAQTATPLKIGIGVAAGEVVMGMLGTEARSELAIIGQAANLAARLQELTKLALGPQIGKEILGEFAHYMAITLPEYVEQNPHFRKATLPAEYNIRNFESMREIAVLSK